MLYSMATTDLPSKMFVDIERTHRHCYNQERSHAFGSEQFHSIGNPATIGVT